MKTPSWLLLGALALWAQAGGQWVAAAALAASLLLVQLSGLRLALDDRALARCTDLCVLLSVGALAYFLASGRMPGALYAAASWLPASTFPLLLAARCSQRPLRHRHLYYTLRRSASPLAQQEVDFPTLYFTICLIAAAVLAQPLPLFHAASVLLLGLWLLVSLPVRSWPRLLLFGLLLGCAAGAGYLGAHGLQQANQWAQQWFMERLAGAEDPYRSRTSIGELGALKMDDAILWRVAVPPGTPLPLRLRDGVFSAFDGQTWSTRRDSFQPMLEGGGGSGPHLELAGSRRHAQVLVPVPAGTRHLDGRYGWLERNPYGVFRLQQAPEWVQLRIFLPAASPADAPPTGGGELQLLRGHASLLAGIPEVQALQGRSAAERLRGVQDFFATRFRYTLALGNADSGPRDLERFLLQDRAGHCEYFATATVLMLRHLDIPARYVTGYSLQEYSRLEERHVLRRRHAHAWAEAWVDGRWQELDTTPSTWLAEEEQAAAWWQPVSDLFAWAWAAYSAWRAGGGGGSSGWLALLGVAAYLGWRLRRAGLRRSAPAARPQPPRDALARQLQALEQELARLGYPRLPGETPRRWLQRLHTEGAGTLDPQQLASAAQLVEALYRQRYAPGAATP